jgi:hypothetical protein
MNKLKVIGKKVVTQRKSLLTSLFLLGIPFSILVILLSGELSLVPVVLISIFLFEVLFIL